MRIANSQAVRRLPVFAKPRTDRAAAVVVLRRRRPLQTGPGDGPRGIIPAFRKHWVQTVQATTTL